VEAAVRKQRGGRQGLWAAAARRLQVFRPSILLL